MCCKRWGWISRPTACAFAFGRHAIGKARFPFLSGKHRSRLFSRIFHGRSEPGSPFRCIRRQGKAFITQTVLNAGGFLPGAFLLSGRIGRNEAGMDFIGQMKAFITGRRGIIGCVALRPEAGGSACCGIASVLDGVGMAGIGNRETGSSCTLRFKSRLTCEG